ncbi:hypothetical protein BV22DRAFT_1071622 [Leucogyrophana mollusca]|uniref:Uncharacterized protein n=1 Tax=Leucogyrophana mollusca TaxID=85980 RepID=A0ACB8BAC5_9AGAM|nr:hypothetical protein BV22DRAFT_1071622 [Leucogyrophana mollusca]
MGDKKLALPAFLKVLTSNDVPVPKAMAVASKIYKDFNTPTSLAQLTDAKLKVCGVEDKDVRKLVLAAVRKAGYVLQPSPQKKANQVDESGAVAGPSQPKPSNTVQAITTPTKRKRKRDDSLLPDGPPDEAASYGSLEFNEVMDEEILKTKSTIVNRAPLMTAWATVVAERLGFEREEALSIASVYTEMNAISKGVALNIFDQERKKELEPMPGGAQPYVDLMGRRSQLYQTQSSQWRALANGSPSLPGPAFLYISRAFRQTTAHIIGALRLLAGSYTPQELNTKGFALYADFRPAVDGWGARGEVRCDRILSLRTKGKGRRERSDAGSTKDVVKLEESSLVDDDMPSQRPPQDITGEPEQKKQRNITLEEYEAALDGDSYF